MCNIHKLNHTDAITFITAGNATFTFLNTESGNRFTFNLKKSKDGSISFLKVLTGSDWTYVGFITNNKYVHSKKSKISDSDQSVKVFKYVFNKLISGTLQDFIEIWHEGKCGKCNRKLTVPSSIVSGIGPECVKKLSKSELRDIKLKVLGI